MATQSRLRIASALIAVCAGAACGSNDAGSNPAGPSTTNTPTINIVGQNGTQAFSPNPAGFGGQRVVFKNNDTVSHRVILNDGRGDTGDIAPGATSGLVTIPGDGTNYHCSVHPGMIGSVAAASGTAPPPCQGDYCNPY
jgi:plastocyanin